MDFEAIFAPGGAHDTASACRLGDTVVYTAEGKPAVTLKCFVNFGEAKRDGGLSASVDQAYDIEIPISQLPTRPGKNDRFTVANLPGETFIPISPIKSDDGIDWLCQMKTVVS
jgi:hypothetical protein